MNRGLLSGYRALELADDQGQLCGRLLADLGMEVVKVESPTGDPVRRMAPLADAQGTEFSLRFAHLNANKKSVVLDLTEERGRSVFRKLAAQADVVIESGSPGTLADIGFPYEDLAAINPRVVLASISAFGQTGPHSHFAYNDLVAFAMGGTMYISGDPEQPPCKAPETQAYYYGSLMATLGLLAALYGRSRTGRGDHVEIAMQECLATTEHLVRLYGSEGIVVKRTGSQHAYASPGNIFPCRDGYVYLYVSRRHWEKLLDVWTEHPFEFDNPEWLNDPYRHERSDRINAELSKFTARYDKGGLTSLLQGRGIPCVPVNRPQDFVVDEHVQERKFVVPVQYPGVGIVNQPAAPFLVDGFRPPVRPAPTPGQHQQECLAAPRASSPAPATFTEHPAATPTPPLSGLRILSFDQVLSGPYGMTLLAELGAEVIKVESKRGGLDLFRFFGDSSDVNRAPRFLEFNRNKKSVTINLKHGHGRELVKDLARQCDVVMDNFTEHVMPSLELAHADLQQVKPDIITLRMPGLGMTGPKRGYATLGTNITAFTGATHLWNHPDRSDPPIGSQTVLPDYAAGLVAAISIVACVLYRDETGKGVAVDLSQAEVMAYLIGTNIIQAAGPWPNPRPVGNHTGAASPEGCYPCKGEDRWCVIAVENDSQWRGLANEMGLSDQERARFGTSVAREDRREELDGLVARWTSQIDAHVIMDRLQAVGVPCGVVQTGADLVNDRHLRDREFIVECDHERVGRIVVPGCPIHFTNHDIQFTWEFPELGHDNEAVFGSLLGFSEADIQLGERDGFIV